VYFAVSDSLEAAATIDSVELRLNVDSAPNNTPQSVSIHRVLANWEKGRRFRAAVPAPPPPAAMRRGCTVSIREYSGPLPVVISIRRRAQPSAWA
jgi:hypothetical protein